MQRITHTRMELNNTERFSDFWARMKTVYKNPEEMTALPTATELVSIQDVDMESALDQLEDVLAQLLDSAKDGAAEKARAHDEEHITPLFENSLTGVVRFDCVLNQNGDMKILELNADYPDGLLLHDHSYSVLSGKECSLHTDLLTSLLPQQDEQEVFVAHANSAGFTDAHRHESIQLNEQGISARYGPLSELLESTSEGVIVRRGLEVTKFSSEDLQALTDKNHSYLNTFDIRVAGYKDLLSTIEHPLVPTTSVLTSTNADSVVQQKDSYVLKPANGCEGGGIYLGSEVGAHEWESLIRTHTDNDYIVQELVEVQEMEIEMYRNETVETDSLYFDMCPHFFVRDGKVVGRGHILMRFSPEKIMNVSKGGGIGYYNLT